VSAQGPGKPTDAARDFVLLAFRYACTAHQLNNDGARQVLAQIFSSLSDELDVTHLPLPEAAPEQWSHRHGRKENPPAFIRRVYGQYLHGAFTRAMLRQMDLPLYQALAIWERRHPDDPLSELPKRPYRPRNTATAHQPN
jgi:hypothetical protein